MKLLLAFLLLSANIAFAQHFEGEIVYHNTYKSKIPNLTDQQLQSYMGGRQDYFIKGATYKSVMNGTGVKMQLYNDKQNRIYLKLAQSDTLYWMDASANNDPVTNYEIRKSNEKVLGKTCDVLIAQTATSTTKLYFSREYTVDTVQYARHRYNNWAFFMSKCGGALPLKYELETPQFTAESVAVEVKPMKLKEDAFAIDEKAPKKEVKEGQ